jgi:hypothetical protein
VLAVMIVRPLALMYGWGNGVQMVILFLVSIALLIGAALWNLQQPQSRYDIGDVRQRQSETVAS